MSRPPGSRPPTTLSAPLLVRAARSLACGLGAAVLAACNSTNPVEPAGGTPPPPAGGSYSINITSSLEFLPVASTDPATITVSVKSVATNTPAAGVTCGLSTSLGSFNAAGSLKVVSLTLDAEGSATAKLYPGTDSGTATLLAQVDTSVSQLDVPVRQSTVFIRSIAPNHGVAEGGYAVRIQGEGFVDPVRVTFGGVVSPRALVKSSKLVEATAPRSPTPVEANSTLTVTLALTSAINKPNPPSDSLSDGFTYTSGDTPVDRPVIFSLDPPSGPNAGGQDVTIFGAFFPTSAQGAQVLFGFASGDQFDGVEATVTSSSAARIEVVTPAASGLGQSLQNKSVDVLVRNRQTGFFTVSRTIYRYGDDLFLGDVQPRSAPATGGTTVTLVGRNLPSQAGVLLAGVAATVTRSVYSCSTSGGPQCIEVQSPAVSVSGCSPPFGPVTLTNLTTGQSVTSSAVFSFTVSKPQLTSLTPTSGAANGGTLVMIFGSGFRTGSTPRVLFNNVSATAVSVNTATNISANTPAFTGSFDTETCTTTDGASGTRFKSKSVDVSVTDLESSCTDTLAGAFTYLPDTSCRADSLAPVANFSYDTIPGQPLALRFINQSSGGRGTSFHWTFGDGFTSSQETVTHTYAAAGTYLVSFTVSNATGTSSVSKQVTVPVPFSPQADRKRRW